MPEVEANESCGGMGAGDKRLGGETVGDASQRGVDDATRTGEVVWRAHGDLPAWC
jgi:hypothetical protein